MTVVVLVSVLFLAFCNGANDNFKGVATVYGSRAASYWASLAWATATTLAGSLLAPLLAAGLIAVFKSKGLVPDDVAASSAYMASAALAGALTVAAATRLGLPVSTTHALTGGLIGAGLVAASVSWSVLARSFVVPLLLGPFVAGVAAAGIYAVARAIRRTFRIEATSCVCIGTEWVPATPAVAREGAGAAGADRLITLSAGDAAVCVRRYSGSMIGLRAQTLVDVVHFLSAGAVSLARGLNDAPKIVALALAAGAIGADPVSSVAVVAVVMALGGLLFSRRVAETMSRKLSRIDPGPGLVANVTAAVLVILGSLYKLPLSTTHVTSGGIVGTGAVTGTVDWGVFGRIALAWLTTLPLGALLGAFLHLVFSSFGAS